MNMWFVSLCCLCTGVIIYSFYKYTKLSLTLPHRVTLISLRIFFTILLAIAIIEPVITFERLSKSTDTVPVLIDHSSSMRLFKPDSVILPFLQKLPTHNATRPKRTPHFSFFLFGDSLRPWDTKTVTFDDKKSNLPSFHQSAQLINTPNIILITDGNFTNPVRYSEYVENKTIYYVKFPPAQPVQSLDLFVNAPSSVSSDSTLTIDCVLTGFQPVHSDIVISCFTKNTLLVRTTIPVDSGQIDKNVTLFVKSIPAGIHMLRISVAIHDSLVSQYHHTIKVSPGKVVYTTLYSHPSMDNRFIQLSASRNPSFVKSVNKNDSLDMVVITRWPVDITRYLSHVRRSGLIVFAGCAPCSSTVPHTTKSLIVNMAQYSPLTALRQVALPPVTILHEQCTQSSYRTIFAGITVEGGSSDTLPLLYTSLFSGHKALVFPLQDFWKWDFVPLNTSEGEESAFTFTGSVIETARELILQNISDTYIVYPINPVLDSDSLQFRHIIPAPSSRNRTVLTRFSLQNESFSIDTTLTNNNISGQPTFKIPPVPAGHYRYQSRITIDTQSFAYTDSLFVRNDNREFAVRQQNEMLLGEIGQPLPTIDTLHFLDIFNSDAQELQMPVKETFHLRRTWWLLLAMLVVFGAELIIRRKAGLM